METPRRLTIVLAALVLGGGMACSSSTGPGALGVQLGASTTASDASVSTLKGIIVTIDEVTAQVEGGGWTQIYQGPVTVDLLQLSTVTRQFGPVQIPSGMVNQIRFVLSPTGPQYVVLPDDSHADLKTPSGDTSGLKLNGSFRILPCETHILVLEFDGPGSIEYHLTGGPTGEWILRPVLHVRSETDQDGACAPDGGTDGGLG